ncbi:UPF0462 protein C4orf33 homolog [Apodemus speciosus]|uniref:UPF0462 protein C4orf33 homolog n=1 Tax=Apodemus speciosus TaxID=105296 RepID=A0ABQ0EKC8_APOSI
MKFLVPPSRTQERLGRAEEGTSRSDLGPRPQPAPNSGGLPAMDFKIEYTWDGFPVRPVCVSVCQAGPVQPGSEDEG